MNNNLRSIGAGLLLFGWSLLAGAVAQAASPVALGGEIDLRTRDFVTEGSLNLDGEWTVFRDQLLDPLSAANNRGQGGSVTVPDVWGPPFTLTPTTGFGRATYVLRVHVPPGGDQLALRQFRMRSIVEIYAHVPAADGGAGEVFLLVRSKDPLRQEDLHAGPIYLPFTAETFDLVFLVENQSHKQGGIVETPEFGLRGAVEAAAGLERFKVSALVVLLAGVSIIALFLGLVLSRGTYYTLFALLGIAGAARIITTSQLFGDFFPEMVLAQKYTIEYLTMFLSLPLIYGFIARMFPKDNFRLFHRFLNAVSGLFVGFALIAALILPPGAVTILREPFEAMGLIMVIMAVGVCLRAYRSRRDGASLAMACMAVLGVFGIVDIAFYLGLLPYSINAGHVGYTIVVWLFFIGVIRRFLQLQAEQNALNTRLQDLNSSLETRTLELEKANQKATAASDAKSNFLAVMSHEIRTPLTGMLGMTTVLESEVPDPEHRRLMAAVRRSGEGLLGLLNDMLNLSKIEAGAIELEKTPFTLGSLIDQINDLWQHPMSEKGLVFEVTCSLPVDRVLMGDEGRIRQILYNLIGNARKFTDSGRVLVDIAGQDFCDELVELEFSVSDSGIGVSAEQREQIFGKFNQADASTTRRFGGTGLGLAICKEFTELMGGAISLSANPEGGTTFCVTLPCEIGVQAIVGETESPEPHPDNPIRILVAEDVELNQEVIRLMLEPLRHIVTIVGDGNGAVAACKKNEFDLILMDLQMPNLDGISATRMIRALNSPISKVPIYALTANVGGDIWKELIAAGMDGMVSKPIDRANLAKVVASVTQKLADVATGESNEAPVFASMQAGPC